MCNRLSLAFRTTRAACLFRGFHFLLSSLNTVSFTLHPFLSRALQPLGDVQREVRDVFRRPLADRLVVQIGSNDRRSHQREVIGAGLLFGGHGSFGSDIQCVGSQ